MSAAAALPTVREELDRKSFETIEWLALAFQKHKISAAQFNIGANALFMAVSGLVDDEVTQLITAAASTVPNLPATERRHFAIENKVVTVSWVVDTSRLTVNSRLNGLSNGGWIREYTSPAHAHRMMEQVAHKLRKQGYTEL